MTQSQWAADKAAMLSMLQNNLMQSLTSELARVLEEFSEEKGDLRIKFVWHLH